MPLTVMCLCEGVHLRSLKDTPRQLTTLAYSKDWAAHSSLQFCLTRNGAAFMEECLKQGGEPKKTLVWFSWLYFVLVQLQFE